MIRYGPTSYKIAFDAPAEAEICGPNPVYIAEISTMPHLGEKNLEYRP
jgi:hypothetical protein